MTLTLNENEKHTNPSVYLVVGTDGTRAVVWGMGSTEEEAEADADRQADGDDIEQIGIARVTADRAARVERGDVDAEDLVVATTRGVRIRSEVQS